jgi:dienelactone hydrolase
VQHRWPIRAAFAFCSFGLILAACADSGATPSSADPAPSQALLGPFPADAVDGLRTEPDIVYTDDVDCGGPLCRVPGDVLAPADASDAPTVVMLGGGATPFAERRYQQDLAVALSERGAVVFLLSYRSAATGNYDSDSFNDARCAVNFARATAAEYGGDPARVVVVGHSMGGMLGLDIATQPEEDGEGCLADGSGKPDGVIGLGAPRPRSMATADDAAPLWLFAGDADGDAEGSAQRLRDEGYDAEAVELPGVTHEGITDPAAAPEIVDLIMDALESV